jgi:hypothetical protein
MRKQDEWLPLDEGREGTEEFVIVRMKKKVILLNATENPHPTQTSTSDLIAQL